MPKGVVNEYLTKVPTTFGIVPSGIHDIPLSVEYSKFAAFVTVLLLINNASLKSYAL